VQKLQQPDNDKMQTTIISKSDAAATVEGVYKFGYFKRCITFRCSMQFAPQTKRSKFNEAAISVHQYLQRKRCEQNY